MSRASQAAKYGANGKVIPRRCAEDEAILIEECDALLVSVPTRPHPSEETVSEVQHVLRRSHAEVSEAILAPMTPEDHRLLKNALDRFCATVGVGSDLSNSAAHEAFEQERISLNPRLQILFLREVIAHSTEPKVLHDRPVVYV